MTSHRLPCPERFIRRDLEELGDEWFGRYRLWFDQVSPRLDDYAALLRVSENDADFVQEWLEALPVGQNWPLHLVRPDVRYNDYRDCERGQPYLCFEMLSDVCYIDMRNLHWAAAALAGFLEDGTFFAYSSGDGPDRWLDEYRFEGGALEVVRYRLPAPRAREARLDFYVRNMATRGDTFRRFVEYCLEEDATPGARKLLRQLAG